MNREGVERLRQLAADAVGKGHESKAFGVLGAELVVALCDGWLAYDEMDIHAISCCCGECD